MGRKKRQSKKKRNAQSNRKKLDNLIKKNPNLKRARKRDPGVPELSILQKRIGSKNISNKRTRYAGINNIKSGEINEKKYIDKETEKRQAFSKTKDGSTRQWYYKELKKVIHLSDIILQVLDARDPMGCRSKEIETRILGEMDSDGHPKKKLVLVLNKIDLVPIDVAQKWLSYLRREFPSIAFKATRQHQKNKLSRIRIKTSKVTNEKASLSTCIGGEALIHLLKNYSRSLNLKKSITVGVIGYPNVGKSSIINSLKRTRSCGVASTPGYTKAVQTVKLDNHISILDSPGVLFSNITDDPNLLLRNCLKLEHIQDPMKVVNLIVKRIPKEQLMSLYELPNFNDSSQFLYLMGLKRGKLGKGGVPNKDHAARAVIADWNDGSIPFYTEPPEIKIEPAKIVSTLSAEFDIEKLLQKSNKKTLKKIAKEKASENDLPTKMDETKDEDEVNDDRMEGVVEGGPTLNQDDDIKSDPSSKIVYKIKMKNDSHEMDVDNESSTSTLKPMVKKKKVKEPKKVISMAERNKIYKKSRKKREKERRRIQAREVNDQLDFSKMDVNVDTSTFN